MARRFHSARALVPAGQRLQLERQLSERLAQMGIALEDPAIQAQLADVLGVPVAEIKRAVSGSDGAVGNATFGDSGQIGGIDGVDNFDPLAPK